MKTHLLPLDPNDDVISVCDQMSWGKSARILLVWPENEDQILNRRLDLLLVRRRAAELGAQLGLVSRNPDVRFHAAELGIPVFGSTDQAQTARWVVRGAPAPISVNPPSIKDPRSAQPATRSRGRSGVPARLFALAAGAAAFLAIAGVLLPRARVNLVPETRIQSIEFTAVTGPTIAAANASGAIPTRALTVVVEGRNAVETSGTVSVPSEAAAGAATFTNLTVEAVRIEAGTILLTGGSPPIRYAVAQSGSLEAGPGTTITLPITAALPGTEGNRPPAAITAVEGLLGLQVTVTNLEPLTGGSELRLAAPTALDRSRAAQELSDSLRAAAAEELAAQIDPTDIRLSTTPFLLTTIEESYLPADDSPAELVEVTLRLEFQLLTITRADLEALAGLVLDAGLEPGYEPVAGSLDLEFLSAISPGADGSASWIMTVSRSVRAVPDPDQAAAQIIGRRVAEARAHLAAMLPLASPPEISMSPAWWPAMPLFPVQIRVEVAP